MAKYQLYDNAALSVAKNEGEKHIYARPVNSVTFTTADAIEAIQQKCTLTSTDIIAVVEALRGYVQQVLKNGDRMKLDGLGTFSVSLSCKKAETEKEIRAKDVRFAQMNFRAAPEMNRELKKLQLERCASGRKADSSIDDRWTSVIRFLSQNAVMTSQDYLALSGATRYRSYEDLKQWETEGKLSAKGSTHSKFYILTNNSPEA